MSEGSKGQLPSRWQRERPPVWWEALSILPSTASASVEGGVWQHAARTREDPALFGSWCAHIGEQRRSQSSCKGLLAATVGCPILQIIKSVSFCVCVSVSTGWRPCHTHLWTAFPDSKYNLCNLVKKVHSQTHGAFCAVEISGRRRSLPVPWLFREGQRSGCSGPQTLQCPAYPQWYLQPLSGNEIEVKK